MLVVVGAMLDSQRDRNGGEAAIRSAAEPGRTVSSGSGRMQPLRGMARELGVVAFAAAAYGAVRAVTEGSVAQAVANAEAVSRIEHTLGIGWEQSVQSLVIGSTALVTLVNWIYIWGHWPVIIGAATFLYVRRPTHYRILRNAIVTSGLIGFFFFYEVPTAPPRLVDPGLADTVLQHSHAYRALQPPSLTNQYAAMPSLHFGWNLLVGIILFAAFTSIAVRVFAVAMPIAMAFAVIATANHFILDVAVGMVVVAVGLAAAVTLERYHNAGGRLQPPTRNPNNRGLRPGLH